MQSFFYGIGIILANVIFVSVLIKADYRWNRSREKDVA